MSPARRQSIIAIADNDFRCLPYLHQLDASPKRMHIYAWFIRNKITGARFYTFLRREFQRAEDSEIRAQWHRRFQKQRSLWERLLKRFSEYFKSNGHRILECHPIIVYIASGLTIWEFQITSRFFSLTPSVRSLKTKCWIAFRALTETVAHWTFQPGMDSRLHRCSHQIPKWWYSHFAAIGSDGEQRLVVYHNSGNGFHLHIQINKQFTLPPIDFNSWQFFDCALNLIERRLS